MPLNVFRVVKPVANIYGFFFAFIDIQMYTKEEVWSEIEFSVSIYTLIDSYYYTVKTHV